MEDDGEYWETTDINLLQQHIDNCFKAIEEMKQEDATMNGPYRLENGRIIDLMQNE